MKIIFLISVVGKVKRGGESTTQGLVSFLSKHADVQVISGGPFSYTNVKDIGFPELPIYTAFYDSLPNIIRNRIFRRLHIDPLSIKNFIFCMSAIKHIRKNRPDILVFRSVGPWGAKCGRLLRQLMDIPFITIAGGWKTGERETARYNPNIHIAVNPEVAEYLQEQLPDVNIAYLPNGITVNNYTPNGPKAEINLPSPIFLGCGYLGDVKRFDLTIKAVELMGKGSLLLLGEGNEKSSLLRMGKKLLGERFMIHSVPHEDMDSYYRAADVLTIPSSGESFGMAYLEAMACNTPVVATRDKNREILVGKGGKLVDPEDIESYTSALQMCLNTDYGDLPRKQAEEFDWSNIGPKYLKLFNELIADRSWPGRKFPIYRSMSKRHHRSKM